MEDLVRDFLGLLEVDEAKLLAWGVVDGGFSREEIDERAESFLQERDTLETIRTLIKGLRDRRLLFDFNINGRRLYRTRMGESVRLFARLRQLFPNRKWQIAPTLVADYRFALRPRVYPARRFKPSQVIAQLKEENLLDSLKEAVLKALLNSPDRGEVELANFQVRATRTMLRDLAGTGSRGIIVGAGTGTGKTLAFYLPALTHIASLMGGGTFWTKALAIYPRNELLKDQLLETYTEARRLDAVLSQRFQRKLIIGAFFGLTPRRATVDDVVRSGWRQQGDGYVCPYLPCPKCGGQLVWLKADLEQGKEHLQCATSTCRTVVSQDEVMLTRVRMAQTQPDIVFTTTESLNRQMGDTKYGPIFGVGARRTPQLVLLDEVHTYSSIHGAQIAYLLRRWRRAVGGRVQFTGLSATLRNASEFFGLLVGLNSPSVEEISQSEDLEVRGMEYQLALRGDPVSGASLLSTSIQTAMLLRRILDPSQQRPSRGAYGTRVFLFTDDLDVTNRLYHNLQDAEGLNSWGRSKPNALPLAALRDSNGIDAALRLPAGQSWKLSEAIGHQLTRPLRIGRTSSQDAGVEHDADVVVATASLEVGFNDPEVGAVMQHKAPLDMASFVQRKGRAGRSRTMRPWTVVVLSDYGRDRIAYQGYDLLFDPLLDEQTLSVGNRYVLRMQATFALMDWFAEQLRQEKLPGSVWNDFAGPPPQNGGWSNLVRNRQAREIELINQLLENESVRADLEEYLAVSLKISADEVLAVMWEPPRALMTAVLPTLLRRLESGWSRQRIHPNESDQDYKVAYTPLPDFVPQNLFSDLNLPEVLVTTPPQNQNGDPLSVAMPIMQAMKEFAPGRVSRRFGISHAFASHWIAPPDLQSAAQSMHVEEVCEQFDEAGLFQLEVQGQIVDLRCVRPRELKPSLPSQNIGITSNGFLDWRSQIVPSDEGNELELPLRSAWSSFIREIKSFTHNRRTFVEVRRFAVGSSANLRFKGGNSLETYIQFTNARDENRASIGFGQSVDGLVFHFQLPSTFSVRTDDPNSGKVRAFRTAYFKHRVLTEDRLDGIANLFQRDWLYQVYLSALTTRALADNESLEEANTAIQSEDVGGVLANVLEIVFQTLQVDESEGVEEHLAELDEVEPNTTTFRQPTHEKILALCELPTVTQVLGDIARVLWEEPDDEWERWAALRFKATVGTALLQACFHLCPQFEANDLLLDLNPGPRPPHASPIPEVMDEIWITESTLGGGGVVEEIVRRYNSDPRNFFRLAESALEASDFEVVDAELTRLLELQATDADVAGTLQQVRFVQRQDELISANEQLRRVLASHAILTTHPVIAALNARILKPGSSQQTDELLRGLLRLWRAEEERLGVEIDARVFAYIASARTDLDDALSYIGEFQQSDATWRFQAIYGLLWPRGNAIRARSLSSYNPFAPIPDADRELLLDVLRPGEERISLHDPDWREKVSVALTQNGVASLVAQNAMHRPLKVALLNLVATPLDINFLHLYPQVEGFRRETDSLVAMLRLRETIQ